jgi:cellobiose-specific phosphotransferase system component IIA
VNDEPHRVEEPKAVTWPLQSDTLVLRRGHENKGLPTNFGEEVRVAGRHGQPDTPKKAAILFAALLLFLLLPAFASSVCDLPCESLCPSANGTPVCEPLSFSADALFQKSVLASGESTSATIYSSNLEANATINCVYTFDGMNRTAPVAVQNDGASHPVGTEAVTAPTDNPGYQQIVPIPIDVRCSARVVNASNPEGRYFWCGAGCVRLTKLYTYPTGGEVEEYRTNKLNATNFMTTCLKSLVEAQKMLAKAEQAIETARAAGQDTAFAEFKATEARSLLDDALLEYGQASYSFDQSDFPPVYEHAAAMIALADSATSLASEAYSSMVYTGGGRAYLDWYLNTTGIMVGDIQDLLDTVEPIVTADPKGPLGDVFAAWHGNLTEAKRLIDEAKRKLGEGDEEGAKSLLQRARDLLLRLKQSIDSTFETVYLELLKAAGNAYKSAVESEKSLRDLVNSSLSIKVINSDDFRDMDTIFNRADKHLAKADESIKRAENSTTSVVLRRNVNQAFVQITGARFQLMLANAKYRMATFKTDSLVALLTVLSSILASVILVRDLSHELKKKRMAALKVAVLGKEKEKKSE